MKITDIVVNWIVISYTLQVFEIFAEMASSLPVQSSQTPATSSNLCEVCQMEHQHITEDWVSELRQDMTYSDVTFLVGDDKKSVLAHKNILAGKNCLKL